MVFISTSLSPDLPSTSVTSPIMLRWSASGHSIIFTTTLSPSLAPFSLRRGMMMLLASTLDGEMSVARSWSMEILPTNVSFALCRISMTCASFIWFLRRAMHEKRTRSPLSAHIELRSATKIGLSLPSGVMVFLPLVLRRKTPSCTCPFWLSWYELSDTFVMKSSHAISSIMSMASIFSGCVSRCRLLKISLKDIVLPGFEEKSSSSFGTSCFFVRRLPPFFPFPMVLSF